MRTVADRSRARRRLRRWRRRWRRCYSCGSAPAPSELIPSVRCLFRDLLEILDACFDFAPDIRVATMTDVPSCRRSDSSAREESSDSAYRRTSDQAPEQASDHSDRSCYPFLPAGLAHAPLRACHDSRSYAAEESTNGARNTTAYRSDKPQTSTCDMLCSAPYVSFGATRNGLVICINLFAFCSEAILDPTREAMAISFGARDLLILRIELFIGATREIAYSANTRVRGTFLRADLVTNFEFGSRFRIFVLALLEERIVDRVETIGSGLESPHEQIHGIQPLQPQTLLGFFSRAEGLDDLRLVFFREGIGAGHDCFATRSSQDFRQAARGFRLSGYAEPSLRDARARKGLGANSQTGKCPASQHSLPVVATRMAFFFEQVGVVLAGVDSIRPICLIKCRESQFCREGDRRD